MLLLSRNYAIAAEWARAELLLDLEPAIFTPRELAQGKRLVSKEVREEILQRRALKTSR